MSGQRVLNYLLAAEIGMFVSLPGHVMPTEKNDSAVTAQVSQDRKSAYAQEIEKLGKREDVAIKMPALDVEMIGGGVSPAARAELTRVFENAGKEKVMIVKEGAQLAGRAMTDKSLSEDDVGVVVADLAKRLQTPLPAYIVNSDDNLVFRPRALQQCNYSGVAQDAASLQALSECTRDERFDEMMIKMFSGAAGMMGAFWAVSSAAQYRRRKKEGESDKPRASGFVPPRPLPPAPTPAPAPAPVSAPVSAPRKPNELKF